MNITNLMLNNRLRDGNIIKVTFQIKSGRFWWGSEKNRLRHMLRVNILQWNVIRVVKGQQNWENMLDTKVKPSKCTWIGKFDETDGKGSICFASYVITLRTYDYTNNPTIQ